MKTTLNNKWLPFSIIIGISLIVLIGYPIYLEVTDKPAVVSKLSIGWSQSIQQFEDVVVPMGIANLRVCGFLESNRERFLYVNIFNIEDGYLYGKSEGEFISPGEFCIDVKNDAVFSGKYMAKIFYRRKEIANLNFEVK